MCRCFARTTFKNNSSVEFPTVYFGKFPPRSAFLPNGKRLVSFLCIRRFVPTIDSSILI